MLTSNRYISAKFRCDVDRNGKVKKSEFYPPPTKKNWGVGVGCNPNYRGEIDNKISCEKIHEDRSSQWFKLCEAKSEKNDDKF